MDEDDRIDLSALDPARNDEARWHAKADAIAARAVSARRRRADASPIAMQLVAWARPALALAAGIALAVWAAALTTGGGAPGTGPESTTARLEPAYALSQWALSDELPPTEDVLQVLGGDHGEP